MGKCTFIRWRWSFPAFLILAGNLVFLPQPARAFDCAKAAGAVEKAICANPQLKVADDAMTTIYAALWKEYDEGERKAMAVLQRKWLKRDRDSCDNREGADLTTCILSRIQKRRRFLSGEPESGPGAAARMIPIFGQQDGDDGNYRNIDLELLKFADPQSQGERLFNTEILKRSEEPPFGRKIETPSERHVSSVAVTLTYASPKFLSARIATRDYGAAIHYRVDNINIDMVRGVELKIEDWFDDQAIDELMERCRARVISVMLAGDRTYDPKEDKIYTEEMILSAVRRARNWAFSRDMISIEFDARMNHQGAGPIRCSFLASDVWLLARSILFMRE